MKPDRGWCWLVKKESGYGFLYIFSKLFPGISLGDDILIQAFGGEATILLLNHLENQLTTSLFHGISS